MSRTLNPSSLTPTPVTQPPQMMAAHGTMSRYHGHQIRRLHNVITLLSIAQSTPSRRRHHLRLSLRSKSASEPTTQTMAGQTAVSLFVKDSACGSAPRDAFHSAKD